MDKTIALVTGASRGIGKATAQLLAERGCKVIGTATAEKGAAEISTMLANSGGCGMVLCIGDREVMAKQLEDIFSVHGAPAILVNNAGITKDNLFMRMKQGEWDSVINVNLTGVFQISQACLKFMVKARYGRIINITSVVAAMGNAGQANYVAAKAGIIGMTKTLAQEVAKRGITVNAVAPGFIETDMTAGLSDSVKENVLTKIPMGRVGQADDVASAVAYLASADANYITGTTLHVNGGMLML